MACLCYDYAIPRIRISTTVDEELLIQARQLGQKSTDASLLDEALKSLVTKYKMAEINSTYCAYDEHPLNEPDEWGDLASFRDATATS